jgi:hypothetical protein
MKTSKWLKKYGTLFVMLCMLSIPTICSIPATTVSASTIQPMSDCIEWRYKFVNGKTYKRLFNYTTNSWIGDWILVK